MYNQKKSQDNLQSDLEGFSGYLQEQERAQATITKYITDIKTLYCFLGERRELNKSILLEYKDWLETHYAVNSVNSMIAALNSYLEFLGKPELKVKSLRVQKKIFLENEMSAEEFRTLVNIALAQGKKQLALMMETMCVTGIRVSELSFFTVENLKKKRIEVKNKGKSRMILIPEKQVKKLLCYAGKMGITSGSVFVSRSGKPKDRSNIWKEMKNLAITAGLNTEKVFPHNLRHLFARTFYKQTKNLAALADLLGHGSMEVTRIYTAESMEKYQEILESMRLCTADW